MWEERNVSYVNDGGTMVLLSHLCIEFRKHIVL